MNENAPSFTLVFNFEFSKYKIEARTLGDVLGIQRLDESESGKPVPMSISDKAKKINEMLERSLRELVNHKDVTIDYLKYVIPYDVKFSDEAFPQINYESGSRRVRETDKALLTLTLKHLLERFDVKLNMAFDVDKC